MANKIISKKPVLKVSAKKAVPVKASPTKISQTKSTNPVKKAPVAAKAVPTKTAPLKKGQKRIALPKEGEKFNVEPPPLKIKEEEKIKIVIKSVQDILKIVGNKGFFEVYTSLKTVDPNYFLKGFTGTFEGKKEVSDFFKERIWDFFKGRYDDIRSSISEFRKGGEEVGSLDLKSLRIPLKMKVLNQHFSFKEFDSLLSIVKFLEASLKIIRTKRDKKEEEEKAREKAKIQAKKAATKPVSKVPAKTIPAKVVKNPVAKPEAKSAVKKKVVSVKKPVLKQKIVSRKIIQKPVVKKV